VSGQRLGRLPRAVPGPFRGDRFPGAGPLSSGGPWRPPGSLVGQGIAVPLSPVGRKCVRLALGRRGVSFRPRKTRARRDGMLRPLLYWMMDL
jgi:hypothetical protein